jgi:nucleoid DNA-binding protein
MCESRRVTSVTVEQTLIDLLAENGVVSVPGLGVFQRNAFEGVSGRDPKRGPVIHVAPKVLIQFVPDESLRLLTGPPSPSAPVAIEGTVEARLAVSLSTTQPEAHALLAEWTTSKVAAIRATAFAPFQSRSRSEVDLGELGVLQVSCVEVTPALEATLGPSHRRFLFRPTPAVCARLGATRRGRD